MRNAYMCVVFCVGWGGGGEGGTSVESGYAFCLEYLKESVEHAFISDGAAEAEGRAVIRWKSATATSTPPHQHIISTTLRQHTLQNIQVHTIKGALSSSCGGRSCVYVSLRS